MQTYYITEDLNIIEEHDEPTNQETKCFLACLYRDLHYVSKFQCSFFFRNVKCVKFDRDPSYFYLKKCMVSGFGCISNDYLAL